MERYDEQLELPPGFRFHPTDEELISHYLSPKVLDSCFSAKAVGDVDLNKNEPWELPKLAKMGEKEWYFFCVRDRKYPTGLRTNRATDAGYWKATGKDKEIYKAKSLVGMKKTLVFYRGRAPKGEKTNWVMHEYRLDGKFSAYYLPKTAKNEWVICRVFMKSGGGKKLHIQGLTKSSSFTNDTSPSQLPPLMDSSPYNNHETRATSINETSHVSCFSNPMEGQRTRGEEIAADSFNNSLLASSSSSNPQSDIISPASFLMSKSPVSNSFYSNQNYANYGNIQYPDSSVLMQDQSVLKILLENNGQNSKPNSTADFSQDSVLSNHEIIQRSFEESSGGGGPVSLDCLWNY